MTAFEHALSIGVDLIECDLRRSSDGRIVLHHDGSVDGTRLSRLTLVDLRARIPTLLTFEELLDRLVDVGPSGRLVLDLKDRGVDRLLLPLFEERPELARNIMVSTVHTFSLRRLSGQFPGMRLALSRGHLISSLRPRALQGMVARVLRPVFPIWLSFQTRWCRATVVAMQHHLIDLAAVRRYHRLGVRAYSWTIDDCDEARRVTESGVDCIATNQPWEVMACLGRRDDGEHAIR